jgi:hypothetical protein
LGSVIGMLLWGVITYCLRKNHANKNMES